MIKIHEDDLNEMLKRAYHFGRIKKDESDSLDEVWEEFKYEIIELPNKPTETDKQSGD